MDILTDKTYKTYDFVSRYAGFPCYYHRLDDKYVQGLSAYLKDTTPYTNYIVKQKDTLDNLAMRFYGNPTYFWVIASYNHIRNPYESLVVGSTLRVPVLSSIEFEYTRRS